MTKQERAGRVSRPTAKDVAAIAGVSPSTVSRVLSGGDSKSLIGDTTRASVVDAARQLGYSPDPVARALRGKGTYLLGLVVREITDPFFSGLIAVLSTQAGQLGYHVILGHAHSDPTAAVRVTNLFDTRQCDGIFLLGDLRNDESALGKILEHHHAVVALCRGQSPGAMPTLNTDNRAGTRLLLDHLYDLGHRRIAYIDGGWLGDIRERKNSFIEYRSERRLPSIPDWIQAETNSFDGGYRATKRLLTLSDRPTAILASDDVMAVGALKAASDAGVHVPNDLSVVGFDDLEFSRFTCPSLTTARQPIEDLGRQSLRIMVGLIRGKPASTHSDLIQLVPELLVRQSTGPVPATT